MVISMRVEVRLEYFPLSHLCTIYLQDISVVPQIEIVCFSKLTGDSNRHIRLSLWFICANTDYAHWCYDNTHPRVHLLIAFMDVE